MATKYPGGKKKRGGGEECMISLHNFLSRKRRKKERKEGK